MEERLQKILSAWGVASRRQAEAMILEGRVLLNGQVAQLGQRADPQQDEIVVDGASLHPLKRPTLHYLLLNKPIGVVCTCDDPKGRKTVLECLPEFLRKGYGIHPVGRLDVNSTGALLLTNDGDLTFHLTHPKHQIAKVYRVVVAGHPSSATLNAWRSGVCLEGRQTQPAKVKVLKRQENQVLLEVSLKEGRNRQIRKVAAQLGHPVRSLHRTHIGALPLGRLGRGQYRPLTAAELASLDSRVKASEGVQNASIAR